MRKWYVYSRNVCASTRREPEKKMRQGHARHRRRKGLDRWTIVYDRAWELNAENAAEGVAETTGGDGRQPSVEEIVAKPHRLPPPCPLNRGVEDICTLIPPSSSPVVPRLPRSIRSLAPSFARSLARSIHALAAAHLSNRLSFLFSFH